LIWRAAKLEFKSYQHRIAAINEAVEDSADDVLLFAKVFDEPEAQKAAERMLNYAYDAEGLEWEWQIDIGCLYSERKLRPEAVERLHALYVVLVERQRLLRLRMKDLEKLTQS
jgi:hypothetical protein